MKSRTIDRKRDYCQYRQRSSLIRSSTQKRWTRLSALSLRHLCRAISHGMRSTDAKRQMTKVISMSLVDRPKKERDAAWANLSPGTVTTRVETSRRRLLKAKNAIQRKLESTTDWPQQPNGQSALPKSRRVMYRLDLTVTRSPSKNLQRVVHEQLLSTVSELFEVVCAPCNSEEWL